LIIFGYYKEGEAKMISAAFPYQKQRRRIHGSEIKMTCWAISERDGATTMERAELERMLQAEGYTELFDRRMEASRDGSRT
jgi:hypothetical protein